MFTVDQRYMTVLPSRFTKELALTFFSEVPRYLQKDHEFLDGKFSNIPESAFRYLSWIVSNGLHFPPQAYPSPNFIINQSEQVLEHVKERFENIVAYDSYANSEIALRANQKHTPSGRAKLSDGRIAVENAFSVDLVNPSSPRFRFFLRVAISRERANNIRDAVRADMSAIPDATVLQWYRDKHTELEEDMQTLRKICVYIWYVRRNTDPSSQFPLEFTDIDFLRDADSQNLLEAMSTINQLDRAIIVHGASLHPPLDASVLAYGTDSETEDDDDTIAETESDEQSDNDEIEDTDDDATIDHDPIEDTARWVDTPARTPRVVLAQVPMLRRSHAIAQHGPRGFSKPTGLLEHQRLHPTRHEIDDPHRTWQLESDAIPHDPNARNPFM